MSGRIKLMVEARLTPEQLAELWCGMGSDGQAEFFNEVAKITAGWGQPLCFQLQYITDELGLTNGGRRVMEEIGNYAYKSMYGSKSPPVSNPIV